MTEKVIRSALRWAEDHLNDNMLHLVWSHGGISDIIKIRNLCDDYDITSPDTAFGELSIRNYTSFRADLLDAIDYDIYDEEDEDEEDEEEDADEWEDEDIDD